jgi:hypothetical protein
MAMKLVNFHRNLIPLTLRWFLSALSLAMLPLARAEELDPPDRVARLSYVQGEVASLITEPSDNSQNSSPTREWVPASLNYPFTTGDSLWVKGNSRTELQIGSASVRLDQNSDLVIDQLDDAVIALRLTNGAMNLFVKRMRSDESVSVDTPNGTIKINRPGEYRIDVTDRGTRTQVKIHSGEAQLDYNQRISTLYARQSAEMFAGGRGLMTQTDIDHRDGFDSWAADRNRRETQSESSRYVADDVIGYEELDHHGSWVSEREYGHVWYPRTVVVGWAPYRYGRWVHVSPWGWTWIDDAPWGFAPFHYGRWANVHGRWGWVPGPRTVRAVYAPALVAWVGSPGVSVSVSIGPSVGWFPLAPREVYIPGYRCSPRHRHSVNIANTVIINNTVIDRTYERGVAHIDYRNRGVRDAVTVVHRDHFVNARPTREHLVRVNQGELHRWQPQASAPVSASRIERSQQPRGDQQFNQRSQPITRGGERTHSLDDRAQRDTQPTMQRDLQRDRQRDTQWNARETNATPNRGMQNEQTNNRGSVAGSTESRFTPPPSSNTPSRNSRANDQVDRERITRNPFEAREVEQRQTNEPPTRYLPRTFEQRNAEQGHRAAPPREPQQMPAPQPQPNRGGQSWNESRGDASPPSRMENRSTEQRQETRQHFRHQERQGNEDARR